MSSPLASGVPRALLLGLLTALACALAPAAASAASFSSDFVEVPECCSDSGVGEPYPSTIDVSDVGGHATDVNVTISLEHPSPDDVDLLLVGPGGQKALLMSDAGGTTDPGEPVSLVFDDAATVGLSDSGPLQSGVYRPSDFAPADSFPLVAGPYPTGASSLAAFEGRSPNGTWSLYAVDDGAAVDSVGYIDSWTLTFGGAIQEQRFNQGAEQIGRSIVADPTTFSSASFLAGDQDPDSTPNAFATPLAPNVLFDNGTASLAGFPGANSDFGILTSGDSTLADNTPQDQSEGDGTANGGTGGARGESAYDVSTLRIDVVVPAGASCLALDYRFLSEEFPEFVGSSFNDAFIAELGSSTWTTTDSSITAPDDFATDTSGNGVNVNGVGPVAVSPAEASDTTYDAATGLVTTKTPITPGNHAVFLSIFDQGDDILDSAVFLDNLRFGAEDAATCRPPFVEQTAPPPTDGDPAGGGGGTAVNPTPSTQTPSNAFTIGSKIVFKNGVTVLSVTVPGPGVLAVTPAGGAQASAAVAKKKKPALVKPARKVATKAGKVKISIKPSKAGKKVLRKKGKLKAKVRISFTPTGGTKKSTVKTITIKRKKK